MSEFAQIITALGFLITAVGTVWNGRKITEVKAEVKTINSQTIAQLADADETRRIDKIPRGKRTKLEESHLRDTE